MGVRRETPARPEYLRQARRPTRQGVAVLPDPRRNRAAGRPGHHQGRIQHPLRRHPLHDRPRVRYAAGAVQTPSAGPREDAGRSDEEGHVMDIPDTWAGLLVSAVRDAVQYNNDLMRSETLRNRGNYEEHLLVLSQFFEYVKAEYKKIESQTGVPLEKLLHED